MRILVISRSPWREDNSFGNSYSSIFSVYDSIELYNICLGDGVPDYKNKSLMSTYQIPETTIFKSFFHRKEFVSGFVTNRESFCKKKNTDKDLSSSLKESKFIQKHRWNIFYTIRDFVWKHSKIDYLKVVDYIKEIKPDVVFLPIYNTSYVNRFALKVLRFYNAPLYLESSLDNYSLRGCSFDPFFWMNRIINRFSIRKIVRKAKKMFVISDKMKTDYSKVFKIDVSVLYKFPDPSRFSDSYNPSNNPPYSFVYTGNLGDNRWKILGKIGKELISSKVGKLSIYSSSFISNKMKKALSLCELCGSVSSERVKDIQKKADVLVHVESFSVAKKIPIRYSISTKIMDYISASRCILAVGPSDIASIDFLSKYGLAIVIDKKNKIKDGSCLINKTNMIRCSNNCLRYLNEHRINKKPILDFDRDFNSF